MTRKKLVTVESITDPATEAGAALLQAATGAANAQLGTKINTATYTAGMAGKLSIADIPTSPELRAAIGAAILPPVDQVATNGDSLTASVGVDWPGTTLATELGVPVTNMGKAGWASSDIAVRQGGLQPALTVTGNTIPATGTVTVTAVSPSSSFRMDGTGAFSWLGILAGVPGTLTHNMDTASWSFTRTAAGSAVTCSPGTPFLCTDGDANRAKVQVFWAGRNNLTNGGPTLNDVVRDHDLMARNVLTSPKRYLVLGVMTRNDPSEYIGGSVAQSIQTINGWLANRHGDRYLDIGTALIERGLALAGLTATAQDLIDIAHGVPPISLRLAGDTTHLNTSGYPAVGKLVADKIKRLGYLPGLLPTALPGQVTGVITGTATDTTQPLTWTATAGAAGYRVESRTGSGAWTIVALTSDTSITISGLSSGVSYDYRVTAINVAGLGSVSGTVTASTAGTPAVVLVSDSFNRADTTNVQGSTTDSARGGTGKVWTTTSQIGIVSQQLARTGTTSTRYAYFDAGVTDGRIATTVVALPDVASTSIGILARYVDANNYYRLIIGGDGNFYISKNVAGVTTNLSAQLLGTVKNGDIVEFQVIGSALTGRVNGAIRATATDTDLATGTIWGVSMSSNAVIRLDDVVLYNK